MLKTSSSKGKSENRNYTRLRQIGIYAQNAEISPTASIINNNSTKCPTFNVGTIGNVNFSYNYSLHFADLSLNNQLNISPLSGTSYTLSPEQLNLLLSTYPNGFVWWASVECSSSPSTGLYYSQLYQYTVTASNISLNVTKSSTLTAAAEFTATDGTLVGSMTNTVWYKFTAPVTANYRFESSGNVDTYGELFSRIVPDGTTYDRVTYNDDGGPSSNFSISYSLNKDDVIYVRVRGYNYTKTGTFSIKVSINATELTSDSSYSNTLTAGVYNWYSFIPSASGYYTICSLGSIDDVCEMYTASGSYLDKNDDAGVSLNFSLTKYLTGGTTYYFMVRGITTSTNGSYTIYVVPTYEIAVNGTHSAYLDSEGAIWYRFQAPYAGTYSFYTEGTVDTYGRIYSDFNPVGDTTSRVAYNDDGRDSYNFKITRYLNTNQIIYIQVTGYGSDDFGDFDFLAKYVPTEITLDDNEYSYISNGNELWYSFTAPTTASYVFYTVSDVDTYGELYNTFLYGGSSTSRVSYNDDSGEGLNCSIIYNLTAGETIYFRVRGYSSSTNGYISLYVSKYLVATFNAEYTLTISSGDEYWYKFTAPNDATYTFIIWGQEDVYMDLYSYYHYEDLSYADEFHRINQRQVSYNMTEGETIYFCVSAGTDIEDLPIEVIVCIPVG